MDENLLEIALIHFEKGDYKKAYSYFSQLATNDYPNAYYYLGLCHRRGLGIEEDQREAYKYFIKAASIGHIESQYIVGCILNHEIGSYGGTVPTKEELKIYQEEESKGTSTPYYHASGIGIKPNGKEAFKWLLKAAKMGHRDAQFDLAIMYEIGEVVKEDIKNWLKWLKVLANKNHPRAIAILGSHAKYTEKNTEKALELYKRAYELGDERAPFGLGKIYEKEQDYKEAFKWYNIGANETRDFEAPRKLSEFYTYGKGVANDYDLAVKWYKESIRRYHETHRFGYLSICNMYDLYSKKLTKEINEKDMISLMITAADYGESKYELILMSYYKNGIDIGEKYKEKFNLLFKARNGDKDAQISFGYQYLYNKMSNNYLEDADEWYRDDSNNNHRDAQFLYSQIFCFALKQDRYRMHLTNVALNGHKEAQYILARHYQYGDYFKLSKSKSIKWYHEAATTNIDAQIDLGYFYGNGILVNRDYQQAYKYYSEAMKRFHELDIYKKRQINLIKLRYITGNDIAETQALNGDVNAQLYLGCLYQFGFEIQQNKNKSIYWYEMAAKQGNSDAIQQIKLLLERKETSHENKIS